MDEALRKHWPMADQDQRITEAISREQSRLRNFIRGRVAEQGDAEDILQDVFYELVEAYRMMKPVEQVTGWLFQVARNRITDLFRRRKREASENHSSALDDEESSFQVLDLLPTAVEGPDAAYARSVLLEELDAALEELPEDQRQVFIAHEVMGYSFKEIAGQTGANVNTLLSRKRYAVLYLRQRLQAIYEEFVKPRGQQK